MKEDKYDVFIAYAEADREVAQWFFRQLKDRKGFKVYLDLHSNRLGNVMTGLPIIDKCRAVLAIWSPEASKSDWVNCESAYAIAQQKIIPIALSNTNNKDIPDPLRIFVYTKFNFEDSQTAQSNEVSPDNEDSWFKILKEIDILLGRNAAPINKNVQCRVLLLDDEPTRAMEQFSNLLQLIGANKNYGQQIPLSSEAVKLGGSEDYFTFAFGYRKLADITVTANGVSNPSNIAKSIGNLDFLDRFDIIIVDMRWNEAPDLCKELSCRADQAGMWLCEKIADVLGVTSNVPIVISTQQTIDSEFVHKALKFRAHSLIKKRDSIALCNILLTVLKRKHRELIRSARVKLIDS